MATCFLFAQHLTNDSCLSLRFNDQGKIDADLQHRSMEDIGVLQENAETIVVIPARVCSLHQVELPWLGEQKARAAIPFALEDQIAQDVSTVHVAFDKAFYRDGRYLVVVLDKMFLEDLIYRLDSLQLDFDAITMDWFALKDGEACVGETGLLVRDMDFSGELGTEPARLYLAERRNDAMPVKAFSDSLADLQNHVSVTIASESFYEWVGRGLLGKRYINLCQGEFQHNTRQERSVFWYKVAAGLLGSWLLIVLMTNAAMLWQLSGKVEGVEQQISVIYREFFPQARLVISPEFRIQQLLKSGQGGQNAALWQLGTLFAENIKPGEFTIEQMRYQNQMLVVSLHAPDFSSLERLQQRLQAAGVKVTQTSASSQEQQVVASLELRL